MPSSYAIWKAERMQKRARDLEYCRLCLVVCDEIIADISATYILGIPKTETILGMTVEDLSTQRAYDEALHHRSRAVAFAEASDPRGPDWGQRDAWRAKEHAIRAMSGMMAVEQRLFPGRPLREVPDPSLPEHRCRG